MARRIQSQSSRSQDGIRTFLSLLVKALAWLVAAILVPTDAIATALPKAVAPYVHWAPILFYGLAFWSFTRALQSMAANGIAPLARVLGVSMAQSGRPAQARKSRPDAGVAVPRAPTVHRMR